MKVKKVIAQIKKSQKFFISDLAIAKKPMKISYIIYSKSLVQIH